MVILIVFGLCVLCFYTYALSPKDYTFSTYEYVNANIDEKLNGLKIAFISDINLTNQNSVDRLEKIVKELNEYPFDMIIFGGDLYDGQVFEEKAVGELFKNIDCKYGKFAVLGEKDKTSELEVTQILNNGGFEVLQNVSRTIYYKGSTMSLIACDEEADISALTSDLQPISLLICHQPDVFSKTQGTISLQLSGHSYGGSLYFPYIGALLAPEGAKTYNHGIYEKSGSILLVSNGVSGPASFPYKFLARNEMNFVILKSSSSTE